MAFSIVDRGSPNSFSGVEAILNNRLDASPVVLSLVLRLKTVEISILKGSLSRDTLLTTGSCQEITSSSSILNTLSITWLSMGDVLIAKFLREGKIF